MKVFRLARVEPERDPWIGVLRRPLSACGLLVSRSASRSYAKVFAAKATAEGFRFERRPDFDIFGALDPEVRIEKVREAVDSLPDEESLVISRLYFGTDQPTPPQLAQELGLTAGQVKRRRDRGFQHLRDMLASE